VEKTTLPTHQDLERLPSLPQVLLKILDAITHDTADLQHLAEIIRQDSSIAARLINVANSSYYRRQNSCDSVDRALMYLGLETVKTLVITAAVKQYFGHFNQQHQQFLQHFWLRSLTSAHCAQVIASLTSYTSPSEAYLCGLLMDLGQLWLLTNNEDRYLSILAASENDDQRLLENEQLSLQTTHCDAGSQLLDSWKLDNFMADAVRYHHQPTANIQQSHHLVKIVNLASDLSRNASPSEHALEKANQLFGFNEELIIELRQRINADIQRIADSMGIAIGNEQADLQAHRQLGEKLSEITQRNALQKNLPGTSVRDIIQRDIQRSLYLSLGIERHIVFIHNAEQQVLEARLNGNTVKPDFVIDSTLNNCLVNQAFTLQSITSSENLTLDTLSITDQQLLKYCRLPYLLCIPFSTSTQKGLPIEGILVAGATASLLDQQRKKPQLWESLINEIAYGLISANDTSTENREITETRIREAIHEASNPLSIINNYLEMLRIKLGGSTETENDFKILKEEIERAGKILLRLKEPDAPAYDELTDINQTLKDLAQIFNHSMCMTRGITLNMSLDTALAPLKIDRISFKQILTNLIKNAIEALPDGGKLQLTSQSRVNVNGNHYFSISIEDNGPGIPDFVMAQLFKPVTSTKGSRHSGVGLSIVKKLMDDMQGQIFCSSDSKGSQFKLLFPIG
jgi:HD-like signal output (HDOD) protein/signal transduction histidine kinase